MPRYNDPDRSSLEDFATARLIAASPDMYTALKAAETALAAEPYPTFEQTDALNTIRAAIAKAEGGGS